jgi:hypothetical protein
MAVSSNAQWVDPDIVVFVRDGVLMGQRVALEAARTIGEPFAIADRVDYLLSSSRAMFSAARTGTIAYHSAGDQSQLVWLDRNGNELARVGKPAPYSWESAASRRTTAWCWCRGGRPVPAPTTSGASISRAGPKSG